MPLANEHSALSKSRSFRITRSAISEPNPAQSKFPRIEDCAHFHYETVDHGCIKLFFVDEASAKKTNQISLHDDSNYSFSIKITCKDTSWMVRRNLTHFQTLDMWLHQCVFDRKYSSLPVLKTQDFKKKSFAEIETKLSKYLTHLSEITDCNTSGWQIFCAPVLHWLELDNHGRHLVQHALGDVADINIPAVAAARVVRRYQAQVEDELSLNVGDMVSIIEMTTNGWWRGKQGLKVGSFPSQCVKTISSATDIDGTHQRTSAALKSDAEHNMPISRKHAKFMFRLRSFLDTRPSKSVLKKRGIFRERVFGCDLGELLHKTGDEFPAVISDCTRFIEKHGLVDGIYRVSGVASHIRHLKYEFDSDKRPDLEHMEGLPELSTAYDRTDSNPSLCDPHSVAGLCKLYFRELPNPLLTYQLYDRFASALTDYEAEERLLKVHDAIQHLPPPHYRTLKHLVNHLRVMAGHDALTSMHCRNLAIVWAPNLLRSRDIEAGLAALSEARIQSVVVEFIIANGDLLFSGELQSKQYDAVNKPPRPRSLMILPAPKLISLEEAQARSKSGIVSPVRTDATSPTGVRMREWTGKSSERRKRRQKKSTSISYSSNSPKPLRSSRKPGLRQTHSVYDGHFSKSLDEPSSTKQTHGWRTKLGSILKKSSTPTQASVPCKVSLRRTQSADSLVSSHSLKKHFRNSDPLIDYQKTTSETSSRYQVVTFANNTNPLSSNRSHLEPLNQDRSRPEPQVPHSTNRSAASDRSQDKQRTLHKAQRSATVMIEKNPTPVKRRETFQITFRRVSPRSNPVQSDPPQLDLLSAVKMSPDKEPSPNLFSDLSCDFPTIMGERGLDFDPMKYQTSDKTSLWHDVVVPPYKPGTEDEAKNRKRLSLHPDKILAAVPPPVIPKDMSPSTESPRILNGSQGGGKERSNANRSSNNNVQTRTNDFIPLSSARRYSQKAPGNSTNFSGKKKSEKRSKATDDKIKTVQSVTVPSNKSEQRRSISVQVYDVDKPNRLKRDVHYGSFIALVGSVSDSASDNVGDSSKTKLKPLHISHSKLSQSTSRSGGSPQKPCYLRKEPKNSETVSPRLDTFNPEGKQREDYREPIMSPRYKSTNGSRSHSLDSESLSTYDGSPRFNSCDSDNDILATSMPYDCSNQGNLSKPETPRPAPLRHERSFSADDELFDRCFKPTPMPRTSHPAARLRRQDRHSIDFEYDDRTYEAWKQVRSKSLSDDEVLSSRDSGCLRKMKVALSPPQLHSPQKQKTLFKEKISDPNAAVSSPSHDFSNADYNRLYNGSIVSDML